MSEGPFSQQEEQDSIGFVFAVLNSLSQEPAASDLERIAELTKSSIDQDVLCSKIYSPIPISQWEHLRNAICAILYCACNGSPDFKMRAGGNVLRLISLLSCKAGLSQSERNWVIIRDKVAEFVQIVRPELEDDLRRLVRIIENSNSKSHMYLESIAQANKLLQLSTSDSAYQEMLHQLQQSYVILHTITLLAFDPPRTDARFGAGAGASSLQFPRAILEVLYAIGGCVSHVGAHPPVRGKLLSVARADDVQSILFGLQALLDAHAKGHVSISRALAIRLLQDLSTEHEMLPKDYWLRDIEEGPHLKLGGEARILKGFHLRNSERSEIIIRRCHLDDGVLTSIRREAITHRQLRHPNVLPFLGVFWSKEHPMAIIAPWVSNGDACTYVMQHPGPNCFMRIVIEIGSALSYLHMLDPPVIHGDLRGRNVLIDSGGGVLLCDFGLSRIQHDITRTRTNMLSGGSFRHTAPELSKGPSRFRTTWRSDIFSFAMTIYELGTRLPPFHEYSNDFAVLQKIVGGDRPDQPGDLGNLEPPFANQLWDCVRKMWDQDPAQRPTASRVHENLRQIDARRKSRQVAHSPAQGSLVHEPLQVMRNEIFTISNLLSSARLVDPILPAHDQSPHLDFPNPARLSSDAPEVGLQTPRMMKCETLQIALSSKKSISVAYSPRGNEFVSGSKNIQIWSASDSRQSPTWSPRLEKNVLQLACLSYAFDGVLFASGSFKQITLWDVNAGAKKMQLEGHTQPITTLSFSPVDYLVASGSSDRGVLLWDARFKAKPGGSLIGHADKITSVAFSPDGKIIASASSDRTVRLWDIRKCECFNQLGGFGNTVTGVSFSPSGQHLAAACDDSIIRLWNARALDSVGNVLAGHQASVKCLAFSPDSTQIASGSVDNTIRMWNALTGASMGLPLDGHTGTVESLAFSPNGNQVVSGSRDKTVKVWSVKDNN